MDKPISQVNKIILEEDKVYQIMVTISVQQMTIESTLDYGNVMIDPLLQGINSSLKFTEIATVQVPLTITLKKNPNTIDDLIDESINFNTRHDWQKEVPHGL